MKFYIIAKRFTLSGPEQFTVSYDNSATDNLESFLFFDTKEQAEAWTTSKEAAEWKDCSFEICEC